MITLTTNFNIKKPEAGDLEWDIPLNENFDIIDSALNKIATCLQGGTEPISQTGNPVTTGRLWYDTVNKTLKIKDPSFASGWNVLLTDSLMSDTFARLKTSNIFYVDNVFEPSVLYNGGNETVSFKWRRNSADTAMIYEQQYNPNYNMLNFIFGKTDVTSGIATADKIRFTFMPSSGSSYTVADIASNGIWLYRGLSVRYDSGQKTYVEFVGSTLSYKVLTNVDTLTIKTAANADLFEINDADIKYKGVSLRPELFQLLSEKDAALGYCPLNGDRKVPAANIGPGTIDNSLALGGTPAAQYLKASFPPAHSSATVAVPLVNGMIPSQYYVSGGGGTVDLTNYLNKVEGGTVQGPVTFSTCPLLPSGAPPSGNSATNKDWVLSQIAAAQQGFPSGTAMVFVQASPPTGWTTNVAFNDRVLRFNASGGGTGGTDSIAAGNTGSHILTISQIPSHTHGVPYLYKAYKWGSDDGGNVLPQAQHPATSEVVSISAGGGQGHTHPLSIKYADVIAATKT